MVELGVSKGGVDEVVGMDKVEKGMDEIVG